MGYLKITFSLAISLVLNFAFSKVQSQTIGPVNLNPVNSPYLTYCSAPITVAPPSQPVSLTIGSGDYEIYSNGSITMLPGFVAKTTPSSTGSYIASLGVSLPQPEFFGVDDLNNVVQYEKMEMGISLPSLETRINEFLTDEVGDYKVASTGYHTAFDNGEIINPYDPEHVSVTAFFYHGASTIPIVRNGFFYKQYVRFGSPVTDWVPVQMGTTIDDYEWRIRFSPPETGSWKCMILVNIDGVLQPEHFFFKFNVIEGDKPGFVEVADNNQYLQFSNGDQFFPVGDNYAWSIFQYENCITNNCVNIKDHRIGPDMINESTNYIDKLTDDVNGGMGGNNTRMIFSPQNFEVEFEKLGNYHTRQIEMAELDNYLEYATSKDVYLSISPLNGYFLSEGPGDCCLSKYLHLWLWNPYNGDHTVRSFPKPQQNYPPGDSNNYFWYKSEDDPNSQFKGIDGVNHPIDFFSDETAKKMWKNKLRYMDARWGYSPNYYLLEISTEINQYSNQFWDLSDPLNLNNYHTQNWIHEMSDYLKNDLHIQQLVTVNYGATPKPIDPDGPNDSYSLIWNDANIDLTTLHDYNDRLTNLGMKADITSNALNAFNKPCLINENDIQRTISICTSNCTEISIHNVLWSSAFSGSYGPGMHWEWRTELDLADEYKAMRNFFSLIDLKFADGYTPFHSNATINEISGSAFENFCLTKTGEPGNFSNKAYGWVHNRSYNEYTFGGCMNALMLAEDNDTNIQYKLRDQYENYWHVDNYNFHFPTLYQAEPKPTSTFQLTGLIPGAEYIIEYYYTSGPNAGTFEPVYNFTFTTLSTVNGEGYYTIINGPPTGGAYPADWAYLVHLSNEPRSLTNNQKWNAQQNRTDQIRIEDNNVIKIIKDISVAPNPNDGTFTVSIQASKPISGNVSLMDVSGNVIQSQMVNLFEGMNRINFAKGTLPAGVYFIRVDGYDEVLKVVVTK